MGKFIRYQEERIALQERKRTRKETMGKYFYDLSKLTFAAMVLGGSISLFQGPDLRWATIIVAGLAGSGMFAYIGNSILK